MKKYILLTAFIFILLLCGVFYADKGNIPFGSATLIYPYQGGTGFGSYTRGDLLVATSSSSFIKLPVGANGQVLKVSGGMPSWGTDLTGSGGSGLWATSTFGIYPIDSSYDVVIGDTTTTSAPFWMDVSTGDLTISGNLISSDNFLTGVAWGDITGTLSDQTDLQAELDKKLSTTTAESTYVKRNDWTTIDDYPTGCSAGNYVQAIGDTLTCAADQDTTYSAGTGLDLTGTTFSLSHLGLESLTDPNANRLYYWNDTNNATEWLDYSNWDTDKTDDLTTATTFSGDISGAYNNLTIGDDKVTEADLKAVNSPTDEYCLTYESTGGDFEWQSCGSGGSEWTDSGTFLYPTETSDDIVIGSNSTSTATFWFDVSATTSYLGTIGSGTTWNGNKIDISDYTNLAAGNHLTLSGDTLDVDDDFLLNTGDTATGDYTFDGGTLFIDSTDDRVGVGTTDPAAKLHVKYPTSGTLILQAETGDGGSDLVIKYGFNGYGWYWKYLGSGAGDNNELQLWSEGAGGDDNQVYGIKQSGIATFYENVYFNDKVGIGTTTPNYTLDVDGDSRVNGTSTVVGRLGVGTAYPNTELHVKESNISNKHIISEATVIFEGPEGLMQFIANDSGSYAGGIVLTSTPTSGDNKHWSMIAGGPDVNNRFDIKYHTSTGSGSISGATGGEKLTITTGGDVGIGDTTPDYKLDVEGTLGVSGTTTLATTIFSNLASGFLKLDANGKVSTSTIDISDDTNLAVSGTLLDLTGDTLSVNEGTLTDGKLCKYVAGTGLDCNYDDSDTTYTAGGTLLQLSGTQFSIKEGTLTSGKICKYDSTNGLVCDYDDSDTTYSAGTGLDLTGTTFSLSHLGLESLTDPNANRLYYWNDTNNTSEWLDYSNWDTDKTDDLTTATTFSGDVSGTYNNLTIQADSVALGTDTTGNYAAGDAEGGNATGLACSGCVDVSDETNLTAGRSLTLNGDTIDIDSEIYTGSFSITIKNATTTANPAAQRYNPTAITITKIGCRTDSGSATIQFDERTSSGDSAGTDVMSSGLTCDSTMDATTTFANASISADTWLSLDIDSISSATDIFIFVSYTKDD